MKKLLKYFPLSLSTTDANSLAVTIAIYILVPAVFALISLLFHKVLLLGTILTLISILFMTYCLAGIVISIFKFAGKIK